jgi:hypothetical protein
MARIALILLLCSCSPKIVINNQEVRVKQTQQKPFIWVVAFVFGYGIQTHYMLWR